MKWKKGAIPQSGAHGYDAVLADAVRLIEAARSAAARSVNAVMTATYIEWVVANAKKFEEVELKVTGKTDDELSAALIDEMLRAGLARRG